LTPGQTLLVGQSSRYKVNTDDFHTLTLLHLIYSPLEIRIKDNGLESIEVIDNGSGIAEPDWPSLALKHHTSKLSAPPPGAQPDLTKITTFGFRGEALSALCALCEKVQVTTCTAEMNGLARILSFDREGRLVEDDTRNTSKMVARQRGTTVLLQKLFHPLPVRRKEFERNAKKEFAKALGMLTSYGLVPCSGGWAGDDDDESEDKDAMKHGVRLIVDGVNKTG
jgi:DNA mismatch repair protein PMS2